MTNAELVDETFDFRMVAGETTELDIVHRGGQTATAEMRLVEMDWEGEAVFLASLRDISERKRMEEQLTILANTDSLTKVLNRRHFMNLAEAEFERSRRYGNILSVILLDLDHFKRVNDNYGHATGDRVLRALVGICHSTLRTIDMVARYGGEEFVILLPETEMEGARLTAERLRQRIEAATMTTENGDLLITASFGVACLDQEQLVSVEKLLDHADQALYRAKSAGRNRVVVWQDQATSALAGG